MTSAVVPATEIRPFRVDIPQEGDRRSPPALRGDPVLR